MTSIEAFDLRSLFGMFKLHNFQQLATNKLWKTDCVDITQYTWNSGVGKYKDKENPSINFLVLLEVFVTNKINRIEVILSV